MSALSCPSCGAATELRNPGIAVAVCEACSTTLYVEGDVLRAGEQSILAEPRSALATGKHGTVGARRIEIVGRIRLDHGRGTWDEWFIEDERGGVGWLVEDERSYTLEARLPNPPSHASPDMAVGSVIQFDNVDWEVREGGVAQVVGAEGQVDRDIKIGSMLRYADLAEVLGERRLLLEFDEDGELEAYLGRTIPNEQVQFGAPGEFVGVATAASSIRCAECGAPFELPRSDEPLLTLGCPYCDALLQLDEAATIVVGRRPKAPRFKLEVGDKGTLLEQTWEVIGRVEYIEGRYSSHEYICHAHGAGYLWLEEDDGHWLYSRPAAQGPSLGSVAGQHWGASVDCGEASYQLANHGRSRVRYVDGAFPWHVRLGDEHDYWTLVRPPSTFTIEKDGDEIEHFEGCWLPGGDLMAVFDKDPALAVETDVHVAQPNPARKWLGVAAAALLFAFFNLIAGADSFTSGRELTSFRVPARAGEAASPIFHIPADVSTVTVRYAAPVDNSWVYLDVELVDAVEEEPLASFGDEVGYYHGSDWSEGSRRRTHHFRAIDEGAYRLMVTPEYDRAVDTQISVSAGERFGRYNFGLAGLLVLIAGAIALSYGSFERQRFGEEGSLIGLDL